MLDYGQTILWLIVGPDGVGKTTFARARILEVSGSPRFVNLDLIAQGLSPLAPDQQRIRAARVALNMMRDFITDGVTFAVQTTLAGQGHKALIAQAKDAGYRVHLLCFFVDSPEECLRRIARRVIEGGHDVPETDVRRRFARSLANVHDYALRCDLWRIFDTQEAAPALRAEGEAGRVAFVSPRTSPPLPRPIARLLPAA